MTIYLDRGPFLTIPDKLHPGQYRVIRNPDWHGELPEIVSFTDFLKWNYTLEYGRYIRELHYHRQLPLPWGVPQEAEIETVIIEDGRYDRIGHARHHMAECCLDFKRVYAEFDYSYTYGELHKDDLTEITAENRSFSEEQRKKIRMAMYEITEENDKLTAPSNVNEFGKAVRFHMERCGLTSDLVADRSGMGVNTVNKMRSGKKVKLETVLAFCVALELEESFRIDLMQKAKVDYDMSNPVHRLYVTIFELMPKANVFQINELLKAEGFTPWTRDCEEKKRYAKKSMY